MTGRPADEDVEAVREALTQAGMSRDTLSWESKGGWCPACGDYDGCHKHDCPIGRALDTLASLSARLSAAVEGQAAAEQHAADAEKARDWAMTRVVRLADATQAAWRELQRARDARANRTGIIGNATLILERELVVVDPSLREAAQEPDTLAETLAALAEDFHVVGEGGVHIGSCPGCRAFLTLASARAGSAGQEQA